MSVQLSSSVISSSPATNSISAAPDTRPEAKTSTSATVTTDSVKLSVTGQVHQLTSQGKSAEEIASSLGLTATVVSSYLGSSAPDVPVSIPASPSPATQSTAVGVQFGPEPR